jgi:6-phosphogluconolactonase (cycloisomerase 2 family)
MKIYHYLFLILISASFTCYAQVTHLESYYDGQGGIEGLHYPGRVISDPSGENLFITAYHGITRLSTDSTFNDYKFIERISEFSNNMPGLWNVNDIAMYSNFLYVTGDRHLNVFKWNESANSLELIQVISGDSIPSIGFAVASKIVISPDKRNLYLASSNSYILVFRIHKLTGMLTYCNKQKADDVLGITVSPDNQLLYSASYGFNEPSVRVFERLTYSDSLKLIHTLTKNDNIGFPSRIAASYDCRTVYVYDNNTADESIIVYDSDMNSKKLTFSQKINLNDCIKDFWFASDMFLSADDRYLYLTGMQDISVFSRDSVTGHLSFLQVIQEGKNDFSGFDNISAHLANDTILYVVSKYNNKLFLFNRNPSSGLLTLKKTVANEDGKIRGLSQVIDVAVPNDGKNLYTLAYGGRKSIGIYHRQQNGKLLFERALDWNSLGPFVETPNGFEVSPDDEHLFVYSTNMYGIRILKRDTINGNLVFYKFYTDSGLGFHPVTDIAFSPDQKNFYTATNSQIVTYKVNPDSAGITIQSYLSNSDPDSYGLSGVKSIIISKDGRNVYTASNSVFYKRGISVYSRNLTDGSLTIMETFSSVPNGIPSIEPSKVLLSNDNRFLYSIGRNIHCFGRDTANGHLTFLYDIDIEDLGIPYIYNFFDAAISADDKSFIGITNQGESMLSFHRNIVTGMLTFEQNKRFSNLNNSSSTGPAFRISSDLKNVYLVSDYAKMLAAYELNIPVGLNDITQGCKDNVVLSVDDGYDYSWSTGETTKSINIGSEGEYSVYVTDSLGREGWDTTYVMFYPEIFVDLGPDSTLQLSDSLYLNPVKYYYWNYRYLWNDSSMYYRKLIICSDYGVGEHIFTVEVSDVYGCIKTDTIKITIENINSITEIPGLDFKLYPNPVNDIITVETIPNKDKMLFTVTDLNGKVAKTTYIDGMKTQLDVSNLPPGIYLGKLIYNKNIAVKKIVIK